MHFMAEISLLFLVLLMFADSLQGLQATLFQDKRISVKRRLELINKPFIKSFQTKYGDILDCVDINNQFAFDHPILKNHTIQMKPNFKVSKQTSVGGSLTELTPSKLLPASIKCPRGTVLVKRIQKEDLAIAKFSSSLGTTVSSSSNPNAVLTSGHQIATVVAPVNNFGASGFVNVWNPEVAPDQLSCVGVYAASGDDSNSNAISAGWAVSPNPFKNKTRLFGYWTKDSGKSTGCYNVLCPGFVQVSHRITLGITLRTASIYAGPQYFVVITLRQDQKSLNWWLLYGEEHVGYWPKELFDSPTGATRAGWGGEIYSPSAGSSPGMGSGHFPEEGHTKACYISNLNMAGPLSFPIVELSISKPDCYRALYNEDGGKDFGRYMYVGGPANCKVQV